MENIPKAPVTKEKVLMETLVNILITKAQNDIILRNQIIINFKLQAIAEHFKIQFDETWNLADSELLKDSIELIESNYKQYIDDAFQRMETNLNSENEDQPAQ